MRYAVHDVFETVQGEGAHSGKRAVFVRFSGCNLWSGIKRTRSAGLGACAAWCDTDFRPRMKLTAAEIVTAIRASVSRWSTPGLIVFTGGEPLLQLDQALIAAVNEAFQVTIAVETNGTLVPKFAADNVWFACAPKLAQDGSLLPLLLTHAHEVKVIVPGHPSAGWSPEKLAALEDWSPYAEHWLHAADPASELASLGRSDTSQAFRDNVAICVRLQRVRPCWRLGVQAHKVWKLP